MGDDAPRGPKRAGLSLLFEARRCEYRPRLMRARALSVSLSVLLAACQASAPPPRVSQVVNTPPPAAAPSTTPAGPKPELGTFGVDSSQENATVKPGNDFYRYVNGHWLDTYQLKADERQFGSFMKLHYRSEDQVKAIIGEVSAGAPASGSIEQQIADFYKSYLDEPTLRAKGIAPLQDELKAIAAIRNRNDLITAFGRSDLSETNAPIGIGVSVDRRDPNHYLLDIAHSGLGLPDRAYYLEDGFKQVLAAYEAHIATMLGFTGLSEPKAKAAAAALVKLETAIAKEHWPKAVLRDDDKTLNVITFQALETTYKTYPWRAHFKAAGIDVAKLKEVNVFTPSAITPLAKLVSDTPLETWKSYLTFHLLIHHAMLLGDTIDNTNFAFFGRTLMGQPEQRERWKRAIGLVAGQGSFGQGLGKLYVARHFPPEAAAKMNELVANLRAAFKQRIESLTWMGPETKVQALKKLAAFNTKIGYPKKWRDFSSLKITPNDLMGNYRAVHRYWYEDQISRLGKPTDRDEWQMTPQTVNAYYDSTFNEIVFPAAILQPPFFDPNADSAVNYGGIGAVIGHEMGHGFDDQGSKSDANGVQRDWWTSADRTAFVARTQILVKQYGSYEPLKGQHINGELTLGENIGDLGGLTVAFHAYQASLGGKPAPVLEGTTGPQRFFLGWGQVWATKQRDETALNALKADPHSPGEFRVNGVVRNVDAWYDAFGVKPGDALYLPAEQRAHIW